MSQKFYDDIDLQGASILNQVLEKLSANPSPSEARIYYNTTDHKVYYYNGTAWIETGKSYILPPVSTFANLPATGNMDGYICYVTGTDQLYEWEAASSSWILPKVDEGQLNIDWLPSVASYTNLPTLNLKDGDVCLVKDENTFYRWNSTSSIWVIPSAYPRGFTNGCRLIYATSITLMVASGSIEILTKIYQKFAPLQIDWTMVEAGVTKQNSKWYYVYLKENPSNKQEFTAFISLTPPSKDQYGNTITANASQAKYHPTLTARFIGTFSTDSSQNIVPFRIIGNYVSLTSAGYNYVLQGAAITKKTPVVLSSNVPLSTSLVTLYVENAGGINNFKYIGTLDAYFYKFKDGSIETICPLTPLNFSAVGTMTASVSNPQAPNTADGDTTTVWASNTTGSAWLQCAFGSSKAFDSIKILELGSLITSYNVQYYNGTTWVNIATGTTLGTLNLQFADITATMVRLLINTASNKPSIQEFIVYQKDNLDSIYYKLDGDSINIGVHGYYEDI